MRVNIAVAFLLMAVPVVAQQPPNMVMDGELEVHEASIAENASIQRYEAQNLLDYVSGKGLESLKSLAPTTQGIGVQYGLGLRTQDDDHYTVGVQIIGVFVESAAGRAGIKPGDWINIIDGTALCNVYAKIGQDDNASDEQQLKLQATAKDLFTKAPDKFRLVLERQGQELAFDLERGPIAPTLAAAIEKRLPKAEEFFTRQRPRAERLVQSLAAEPKDLRDIKKRGELLETFVNDIRKFQSDFQRLVKTAQVPEPEDLREK